MSVAFLSRMKRGLIRRTLLCLFKVRRVAKEAVSGLFATHFKTKTTFLCELEDHKLYCDPADQTITYAVLKKGHWNRDELERAVQVLRNHDALRPGGVFIDVGANIGTQTIYAMRTGAFSNGVAFEPAPGNLRLLDLNVAENGLAETVRIVPAAIGARSGKAVLSLHPSNLGAHSLRDGAVRAPSGEVEVDVLPLDDALANAGVLPSEIGLLWIDVEGHEPAVIEGASAVLQAGVPLVFEFLSKKGVAEGSPGMIEGLKSHYSLVYCLQDETCSARPIDIAGVDMVEGDYLVFAPRT